MANLNQSSVYPRAFPLEPGDSGMSLNSHQRREVAWHRTAVTMAAWFEIIVGASFLLVPNVQAQFLFGATPDGIGVAFARLAGIGLIGLGIACAPSNLAGTRQVAVRTLLIFNIGATILFAWVAVATTFRGIGLWPVTILHAIIAIALGFSRRKQGL